MHLDSRKHVITFWVLTLLSPNAHDLEHVLASKSRTISLSCSSTTDLTECSVGTRQSEHFAGTPERHAASSTAFTHFWQKVCPQLRVTGFLKTQRQIPHFNAVTCFSCIVFRQWFISITVSRVWSRLLLFISAARLLYLLISTVMTSGTSSAETK